MRRSLATCTCCSPSVSYSNFAVRLQHLSLRTTQSHESLTTLICTLTASVVPKQVLHAVRSSTRTVLSSVRAEQTLRHLDGDRPFPAPSTTNQETWAHRTSSGAFARIWPLRTALVIPQLWPMGGQNNYHGGFQHVFGCYLGIPRAGIPQETTITTVTNRTKPGWRFAAS
jgi:hypothetical protein